jgi:hypothetical protein
MGKKNKQKDLQRFQGEKAASERDALSSRGKMVIAAGVGTLALGFIVLSRADAMGKNWAATLAPFLILGAYVVIGAGIFVDDPAPSSPSSPSSSSEKTT